MEVTAAGRYFTPLGPPPIPPCLAPPRPTPATPCPPPPQASPYPQPLPATPNIAITKSFPPLSSPSKTTKPNPNFSLHHPSPSYPTQLHPVCFHSYSVSGGVCPGERGFPFYYNGEMPVNKQYERPVSFLVDWGLMKCIKLTVFNCCPFFIHVLEGWMALNSPIGSQTM